MAEADPECLAEVERMLEGVRQRWKAGTLDILMASNPDLLYKWDRLEDRINSLIHIVNKPRELKKRWKSTLEEYEMVLNCAIAYAERHQQSPEQ